VSSTLRLALRQFLAENLPSEWSDTRSVADMVTATEAARALLEARQAFLEKRSPRFNLDVATER
jgi:hypothetical protein